MPTTRRNVLPIDQINISISPNGNKTVEVCRLANTPHDTRRTYPNPTRSSLARIKRYADTVMDECIWEIDDHIKTLSNDYDAPIHYFFEMDLLSGAKYNSIQFSTQDRKIVITH
jgi:hypothetical protein